MGIFDHSISVFLCLTAATAATEAAKAEAPIEAEAEVVEAEAPMEAEVTEVTEATAAHESLCLVGCY